MEKFIFLLAILALVVSCAKKPQKTILSKLSRSPMFKSTTNFGSRAWRPIAQ